MKNIFVSSTFRDFHQERDLLRNSVLPEINRIARQYGETVNFCDLRWGIDTEEEYENATAKILSSCLDEIDRARPYMIVLLGDRYGFIPNENVIAAEAQKRNLDLKSPDISVTQLEIEYGALQNQESLSQTLFYFREDSSKYHNLPPEDPDYQEKLACLKRRISQVAGDRVRSYSGGADFAEQFVPMVTHDLQTMLKAQWEKNAVLSKYDLDNMAQWNFVEDKAAYFCAHSAVANEVLVWFQSDHRDRFLALTGEGGAGKSTCFSHLCVSLRKLGWDVIPFMGGTTQISTDEIEILRSFIWQMESILGLDHLEELPESSGSVLTVAKLREHLQMLCQQYNTTNRKLLLAVDAVDQLFGVRRLDNLLCLPEPGSGSVSVLLTTRTGMPVPWYIATRMLPNLTDEEKKDVIKSISQKQGRWLSPSILQQVMQRQEAGNPLYLYLILNRLYLMDEKDYVQIEISGGDIAHINQRQLDILQRLPNSKETFAVDLLKHIIRTFGYEELWQCVAYIGLSRAGLRSSDLEALLAQQGKKFVPYRFHKFINFLDEMFLQRNDGRFDFQHQSFRDGIRADLKEDVKNLRLQETALHLLSLPQDDPVRIREITDTLSKAGMYEELYRYIHEIHELPGIAEYAQDDLYNIIKSDPDWVVSRIREESGERIPRYTFVRFFLHHVSGKFRTDQAQKAFLLDRLSAVRDVLIRQEAAVDENSTDDDDVRLRYLLAWCCTEIGRIYKDSADDDELQKGYRMLEQACHICQDIFQTRSDKTFCAMEFALSLMELGDFMYDLSVSEYQKYALTLYQHALELAEQVIAFDPTENDIRNLVVLYERISIFYRSERLDVETPKGFEYMQKGIEQMERLIQLSPTARNQTELSNILSHLAQGYAERQDNDSLDKAISLYHRVFQIRRDLYNESHTLENAVNLCDVHMSLGWVYRKRQEQSAQQVALEHYMRAYELADHVCRSRQLLSDEKNMIRVCYELGITYAALGGIENLAIARKYIKKALALAEQYYSKMENHSSFRLFLRVINRLAEINLQIDGSEVLNESVEILEKATGFVEEKLAQGQADHNLTRDISALYDLLGLTYEKLGGPEAKEKALKAYLQELKLTEAAWVDDKNSVFHLRNMEICENKIGNLLASMHHCDRIDEGLVHLAKALDIAKLLSERYTSDQYLWDLSFCYKLNSKALMRSGQSENLHKAKAYLLTASSILENLALKNTTTESRRSLMLCYSDLSNVYRLLRSDQEALDVAQKACAIADEIVLQRSTGESMYEGSEIYGDLAFCLVQSGNIHAARDAYTKSISYAQKGIQILGTYRTYMHSIRMHIELGDLYAQSGDIPAAVSSFDAAVELAETYITGEIPVSYRSMCVDVYMALVERYEKILIDGSHSKIILLYRKSLTILEPLYEAERSALLHGNLEHIYYGLAEVYMADHQFQNAIVYFQKYLQLYPVFDEQARVDRQCILEYSCYSRIGVCYAGLGEINSAIEHLRKAINLQMDALRILGTTQYLREVLQDQQRDCKMLVQLYSHMGDHEQMLEFMKLEISLLEHLSEMDPVQYSQILKKRKETLKKWKAKNKITDEDDLPPLQREAIRAYQDAEGEMVIGNIEKALSGFQQFQELVSRLPKRKRSTKLEIYLYNSYSMTGAMLANRNTPSDRKQAIQMYKQAISCEIESLKKTHNPFRKKEIRQDLASDKATLLMLCAAEGDPSELLSVLNMITGI